MHLIKIGTFAESRQSRHFRGKNPENHQINDENYDISDKQAWFYCMIGPKIIFEEKIFFTPDPTPTQNNFVSQKLLKTA